MTIRTNKLSLAIMSALTVTAITMPTFAEEAEKEEGLETITVTSQKRVERVSEVPGAVSVLGSDQIDSSF